MPATRSITWYLFQRSLVRKVVRKPSKLLSLQQRSEILLYTPTLSDDWVCAENHNGWLCTQIPPEFFRTIQCNKGIIPNTQAFEKKNKTKKQTHIQGNVIRVGYEKN